MKNLLLKKSNLIALSLIALNACSTAPKQMASESAVAPAQKITLAEILTERALAGDPTGIIIVKGFIDNIVDVQLKEAALASLDRFANAEGIAITKRLTSKNLSSQLSALTKEQADRFITRLVADQPAVSKIASNAGIIEQAQASQRILKDEEANRLASQSKIDVTTALAKQKVKQFYNAARNYGARGKQLLKNYYEVLTDVNVEIVAPESAVAACEVDAKLSEGAAANVENIMTEEANVAKEIASNKSIKDKANCFVKNAGSKVAAKWRDLLHYDLVTPEGRKTAIAALKTSVTSCKLFNPAVEEQAEVAINNGTAGEQAKCD